MERTSRMAGSHSRISATEAKIAARRASERLDQLIQSSQELINQSVALRTMADALCRRRQEEWPVGGGGTLVGAEI